MIFIVLIHLIRFHVIKHSWLNIPISLLLLINVRINPLFILLINVKVDQIILYHIKTTESEPIPLGEPLPYGTHHINPLKCQTQGGLLAEFILNSKGLLKKTILQAVEDISCKKQNSNDPAVRLAFASRLDTETRSIQDRQVRNFNLMLKQKEQLNDVIVLHSTRIDFKNLHSHICDHTYLGEIFSFIYSIFFPFLSHRIFILSFSLISVMFTSLTSSYLPISSQIILLSMRSPLLLSGNRPAVLRMSYCIIGKIHWILCHVPCYGCWF